MKALFIAIPIVLIAGVAWGQQNQQVPHPATKAHQSAYQRAVQWQNNHPHQCGSICRNSPTWVNLFSFFGGMVR